MLLLLVRLRPRVVKGLYSSGSKIGLGAKSVSLGPRLKPLRSRGFNMIRGSNSRYLGRYASE